MTNAEMIQLLKDRMEEKITDGKRDPIGYGGGSLEGLTLREAEVFRSPCRALRWLTDNSPFVFETFVRLTHSEGYQGLIVRNKKTGAILRTVEVRMGGGEDGDPKNAIYINNRKIIREAIKLVQDKLDAGGW